MTREEVFVRLKDIFADVFDCEVSLSDDTTAADVEGWDSFAHINLMGAIEDEFDVKFDIRDVVAFKSVGDIVNKLVQRLDR